jgi:hypothetical protein
MTVTKKTGSWKPIFIRPRLKLQFLTQEEEVVTKYADDVSDSYDGDIFCGAFQA